MEGQSEQSSFANIMGTFPPITTSVLAPGSTNTGIINQPTVYGPTYNFFPPSGEATDNLVFSNIEKVVSHHYPRQELFQQLINKLYKRHLIVITGIAGSGKSQLATYYANDYKRKYPENITYKFIAKDKITLQLYYKTFAVRLGLSQKITDEEEIKIYVKNWLNVNKKGFLLFIDNVDSNEIREIIEDYFPNEIELAGNKQIIITSQNRNFYIEEEKRLDIDGFTPEEARRFLKDVINDENLADILAEKFSRLPLGVATAKLYISKEMQNNPTQDVNLVARQYLAMLEIEEARQIIESLEDNYNLEFYKHKEKGWRFQRAAIKLAIKKVDEIDSLASCVIRVCAFLAPDNIPVNLMRYLQESDINENVAAVKLKASIYTLESFSLIMLSNGNLSIHRITQEAVISLLPQDGQMQWVGKVLLFIKRKLTYDDNQPDTLRQSQPYSLHAETIISQAKKKKIFNKDLIDILIILASYSLTEYRAYHSAITYLKLAEEAILNTGSILSKEEQGVINNHYAYAYFFMGDYQKAEDCATKAKTAFSSPEPNVSTDKRVFDPLSVLGNLCYKRAQYLKAMDFYTQARDIYPTECPNRAIALHAIANVYYQQAYFLDAVNYYKESLKMKISVYHTMQHPNVAITCTYLGKIAYDIGNYILAYRFYTLEFELKKLIYRSENHLEIATSYSCLGKYHLAQRNLPRAREYFQRALHIFEHLLKGKDHIDMVDILNRLGIVLCMDNDFENALVALERAAKIFLTICGEQKHVDVANYHLGRGNIYMGKKKWELAIGEYNKAIHIYRIIFGPRPHVAIQQAIENIAYCHVQLEDNEAEKYQIEAKTIIKELNKLRESLDKEFNFILTDILKDNDSALITNNNLPSSSNSMRT